MDEKNKSSVAKVVFCLQFFMHLCLQTEQAQLSFPFETLIYEIRITGLSFRVMEYNNFLGPNRRKN